MTRRPALRPTRAQEAIAAATARRDAARRAAGVSMLTNPARVVAGWCATCHTNGQYVLAADPINGTTCRSHHAHQESA